jgi:hypothetical protein
MEMKYLLEEENVACLPDIPSKKVKQDLEILRPKHRFSEKDGNFEEEQFVQYELKSISPNFYE